MKLLFSASWLLLLCFWSGCDHSTKDNQLSQKNNSEKPYSQTGKASYYANALEGQTMASGDPYLRSGMTAAHHALPLGTIIHVTNLANDSTVQVEITDRGPHSKERILDLSRTAAQQLGFIEEGEADIFLEVVRPAEGYTLADSVALTPTVIK